MLASSSAEVTGCKSPAWRARTSRPASVVSSRSAGLLTPSRSSRVSSASALPETTLTVIPVAASKASKSGLISTSWRAE